MDVTMSEKTVAWEDCGTDASIAEAHGCRLSVKSSFGKWVAEVFWPIGKPCWYWEDNQNCSMAEAKAAAESYASSQLELMRLRAIAAGEVDQVESDGRENSGRRGDWTQMVSGRRMWPLDPRPGDILITDVAHGLALANRYGGHTREPFNVAQHSVLVSLHCDPADAGWGLLHDATEGLGLPDIVGPVKRFLPWFKVHEKRLMRAVCQRYGLDEKEPPSVKLADRLLLATEKRDLMSEGDHWAEIHGIKPLEERITPWSWQDAERRFLERFEELFPGVRERESIEASADRNHRG